MRLFTKILIGVTLSALPVFCAPITPTLDTWYGFYWNTTGGQAYGNEVSYVGDAGTTVAATSPGGGPDVSSWTIVVPVGQTYILNVTDLYTSGDTFNVYDNASLLSGTVNSPDPSHLGSQCAGATGNDPVNCISNSYFYHGAFTLTAGSNTITISDVLSAPGTYNGSAAFEFVQGASVPEPATLSLMGLGLLGLFFARRAKRV